MKKLKAYGYMKFLCVVGSSGFVLFVGIVTIVTKEWVWQLGLQKASENGATFAGVVMVLASLLGFHDFLSFKEAGVSGEESDDSGAGGDKGQSRRED